MHVYHSTVGSTEFLIKDGLAMVVPREEHPMYKAAVVGAIVAAITGVAIYTLRK